MIVKNRTQKEEFSELWELCVSQTKVSFHNLYEPKIYWY